MPLISAPKMVECQIVDVTHEVKTNNDGNAYDERKVVFQYVASEEIKCTQAQFDQLKANIGQRGLLPVQENQYDIDGRKGISATVAGAFRPFPPTPAVRTSEVLNNGAHKQSNGAAEAAGGIR